MTEPKTGPTQSLSVRLRGQRGAFRLDVAFEAPATGVTALFGPSGSGKTTVLRGLAGLERLEGRVALGDMVWQDEASGTFAKTHERPIGYVFQEASLFPHLSVERNLTYGLARVRTEPGRAMTLEGVVDLLGLQALRARAPGTLSGGERQRVAIGRALLAHPKLLLLDEPLSALDQKTRATLLPYFEALRRSLRIPMIYVSHDVDEVMRLADRVVLIDNGRAHAEGPVQAMFERLDLGPATGRFEAGVVLSATVAAHEDAHHLTRLEVDGQSLFVPKAVLEPGQKVRVRVRAGDVAIALDRPAGISIQNCLEGRLVEIREEPDTAFAETLIDLGTQGLRARLTRRAAAELALEPGLRVHALVKSVTFTRRAVFDGR
ncbi:MAG: molybdenum ABC transporter ATP-binding protein [Pseudomonadota bacterium]